MDVIDFLNARIDEDEAAAREHDGAVWVFDYKGDGEVHEDAPPHPVRCSTASGGTYISYDPPPYVTCDQEGLSSSVEPSVGQYIARHDPARALRECTAKRVAVDFYLHDDDTVMSATIRAMAAVYSDHPDYSPDLPREESGSCYAARVRRGHSPRWMTRPCHVPRRAHP